MFLVGLLSPRWRQNFTMLESANVSHRHLFSFLTLRLYVGKGGFRHGITWHITVNLCPISCCNTSTKAVNVSPNISGSTEGSYRLLDPISRTKISGFVALVAVRSKRTSFSIVRPPFPISLIRQEFFKSKC